MFEENSSDQEHKDAKVILANAVQTFEVLFPRVTDGLPQAISQTGERYIQVTADGIFTDGEISSIYDFLTGQHIAGRWLRPTPRSAVGDWYRHAEGLARAVLSENPTLYWRIKPEIELGYVDVCAAHGGLVRMPCWQVYSRLLISSKPVVENKEPALG